MTTSNTDLIEISRILNIPRPIICFDEDLATMKRLGTQYFVLNLGHESNGGTHWVGLCIRNRGKEMLYFDSYGVIFPNMVRDYSASCSKKGYNVTQIQDLHSNLCGWYVMGWLKAIQGSTKDMYKATNDFVNEFWSDYDGNSELLKMMFINNYHLDERLKTILLNGI